MRRGQRSVVVAALVLLVTTGCLESVARCLDGRICARGLVCDDVSGGCVDPAPCSAAVDGTTCRTLGVPAGECLAGECVPTTCGDSVHDEGEACDDGDLLSHDGCSSDCALESPKWTLNPQRTAPAPGYEKRAAYDTERGRVVILSGDGTTWEWDGSEWTQSLGTAPPSREYTAMDYDGARHRMVMFGGRVNTTTLGDTWVRDGIDWIQLTPPSAPPARWTHAMAYDAARRRVVLFGGFAANADLGDTWEWDGVTWTQRTPAVAPPPRRFHAMAYDAARGRVVLFGGLRNTSALDDTWEWDGSTWTQLSPPTRPGARYVHAIAYDASLRRVVLFGGSSISGFDYEDTWEWDGTSWNERMIPGPEPRERHALVYSAIRGRVVLFGGSETSSQFNFVDTWEYRHETVAPDETCAAASDGDGDGRFACDDPDCWGYCTPSCPPGAACDLAAPRCGDGACNSNLETTVCPADC